MDEPLHSRSEIKMPVKMRTVAVAILALLISVGITAEVGRRFYVAEKEVLQQQGQINAKESAREYDRCLLTRVNIVTVIGYAVDTMIAAGKSNDEIEQFITDETNYIIATLDPSTTGLYGWINGEYLDGAGWVPEADYVPTERPWYLQTLASNDKITFVEPYIDMQTRTVMMSVSELLSDGKSVVAMDVSLDPMQQIVEKVASTTQGGQALVLDRSGIVVAHSEKDQRGLNYMNAPEGLGSALAHAILGEGQMQFDLKTAEGNYSVYVDLLQGGWYSVSLINSDIWYRPLRSIILSFYLIVGLIVTFLIAFFLRLNAKNQSLQRLLTRIDQEEKRSDAFQLLSETDRMTGLFDRVYGKKKVDEYLSQENAGMFLMLDIDHFKAINDTYGHHTGDCVILAVADALRATFRSNDVTIRLGGDEFGVFAVGIAERETGEAIIRRLFQRLGKHGIEEMQGNAFSVSVGAVVCDGRTALSFDELYAHADTAMYSSKKIAGNSLTFSEP